MLAVVGIVLLLAAGWIACSAYHGDCIRKP